MKPHRRGGLATLLATLLLIALVVAGVVMLTGVYNTIFGGVSNSVNVIADNSVITVNSATGGGMILIVLSNKGPGTLNVRAINITTAAGNDATIIPVSNTQAVFGGAIPNSTGSIVAGVNVGFVGSYLAIPPGQSASFRLNVVSGLSTLFPPDQNFRLLIIPYGSALIRLTVQSISE
jgi:hypothetical protein